MASGWTVEEPTLRGESARHYASLRLLATKDDWTIRLKQSFNDWWVPVANDVNLRRVEDHVVLGEEIVDVGKDYHGRPGACAQILGTTAEAYVVRGVDGPPPWADVYGALEAAVPSAASEARRTSFAERSYWMRWARDTGPWDSHEFTRPRWMRPDPDTIAQVAWASTPDRWAPMPGAPDSVATLQTRRLREMQVLFRQPMTLNYTSWLRITEPQDAEGPVGRRDPRYPQKWDETDVRGRRVQSAAMRPAVGMWFFAWSEGDRSLELQIRAGRGWDRARAVKALEAVLG